MNGEKNKKQRKEFAEQSNEEICFRQPSKQCNNHTTNGDEIRQAGKSGREKNQKHKTSEQKEFLVRVLVHILICPDTLCMPKS